MLLLAENTPGFFAELLAVWSAGAAAIPIDSSLSRFEIGNIIRAAEPRFAVRTGPNPAEWDQDCPLLEASDSGPGAAPGPGYLLDDDALILFTSGSTGAPKGVVHTHRSLLAQWTRLRQTLGTEPYARTLCLLPVFFGHGLICNALFPLLAGCDLYLGPAFTPQVLARLSRIIDERRITAMSSVPTLWRLALRLSQPPKERSLRRVHCGSAPLSADLWRRVAEWAGAPVVNTYGITETASWLGGALDDSPRDGRIGKPWGGEIRVLPSGPDCDLSIADECAPGAEGHIWARTPALMKGYFRRDDLTRAVVHNGWFYTGDVGFRDEQGDIVLTGRAVDEINKGGLKVQPQDVENVAVSCPHVSDACAFAVEDGFYGQNVGLAVVMDDSAESLAGLERWMRERLSHHKLPAVVYRLDALPRTPRGKLHRPTVAKLCATLAPAAGKAAS